MLGPGLIYKACMYPSSYQYKVRNESIQSKNLQKTMVMSNWRNRVTEKQDDIKQD